ncbi:Ankyrin repeats (3 copies) family protein [Brugia pahangi]
MSLKRALNESDMIGTARILDSFPSEIFSRDNEDRLALHYAAETADAETFKRILEMDHSLIHCQDQNGYTPLLIASMSGNVPAIKLMIENNIQINHIDKEKHSAVHWAVACGQLEALITLLESGARVDCVDNQGAQAVHYAAAATTNDITLERCEAILHILLKYGANVNARDIDGRTPILWAASCGNLEIVIILSQIGGDIYATDRDQLGAIHCAASHGHIHIIEYLISNLDPFIVNSVDRNGDTALFYAVTLGHYECARLLLLNGAEVNHQDRHLRCPIHCAAAKGQLRMLKLLKQFGGSCEIQNQRGDLPIHEAIQAHAKDCVEYLLALHPSSINVSNYEGRTGLHLAAASGNMEMVILLCTRNAAINPLMLYRETLLTPLDLAMQKNHEMIVEYLHLRQDAKLADELSEEIKKQTKLSLKHRFIDVQEGKPRSALSSNVTQIANQAGKLAVTTNIENNIGMKSVSEETQTAMQIYRVAATNTSRPESHDSNNVTKICQSTSPIRLLIPKATSTADLEQYLPKKQFEEKNEKIGEINNANWSYNNYWSSEEDEINNEYENKKQIKLSKNNLNKSRNEFDLQLKQLKENERLYDKNENKEKLKKKFVAVTRIDEILSNNDNDDNDDNNDNGKHINDNAESSSIYGLSDISHSEGSIIAMNDYQKCYSQQKMLKNVCKNDFEKKLAKSVGSLQVGIYRNDCGEVIMQQKSNKNKRIGQCYAHEEAIFNELTHLKKMQLQYGKVKEPILVRTLINNFCKMYNLNPIHFKFNTFHAWEKFLCDQLKLLYLEERNRIFNSHRSRYLAMNKYKTNLQQKQVCNSSTALSTITEGIRSAHSDSSQTAICSGEKRCNCLYNKRDLL